LRRGNRLKYGKVDAAIGEEEEEEEVDDSTVIIKEHQFEVGISL
jgi:hypothetical protein